MTQSTSTREYRLPDLGEGVKEGQVMRLLVAEGDTVREDQPLMEVETDKAAVEIPSPYAGTIARLHVSEQQVVNVGDLMVTFGEGGAEPKEEASEGQERRAEPGEPVPAPARAAPTARAPDGARRVTRRRKPASPAVRKLARNLDIDLEQVEGSGPAGRVSRADVERAMRHARDGREDRAEEPPGAEPATSTGTRPAPMPAPPPASRAEPPGREDSDQWGPVRRQPISQTRKAIASVMSHSASIIPHVTDSDDADVTDLDRLRRGYNDSVSAQQKLGMLPFVIRAVARALQMHPIFNASFDESTGEIVYKRYYHLAFGVQTERGLVAPVLRDVHCMGIAQINEELNRLIEKARGGKLTLEDTRGGTYTISNAGAMGGSRYSTPIITHPQVAVLAIGKSRMQPWVVDGQLVPRLIMPLSHSMDHRIIDGALEIAFMQQVIGDLENPGRLML